MNNFSDSQASDVFSASIPDTKTDTITIPLLAEGLLVKREKKKVGTVLIKKEIHTRIVEVPIRREVIVVEQVASPPIQLAAIDLTDYQNPEYNPDNRDNCILKTQSGNSNISEYVVECKFFPVKIAAEILQQIATQIDNEYVQVSLEILVSNSQQQVQIQQIINQLSEPRISS